jgi:DNA mismatch repair protein MutS2
MSTLFENALNRLEWDKILEVLLAECLTPYGYASWQQNPFLETPGEMSHHAEMVDAFKLLLVRYGDVISETDIPDIGSLVKRLAKGGVLSLKELGLILKTVLLGGRYFRHFRQGYHRESSLTCLDQLMDDTLMPDAVQLCLEAILESNNRLSDPAVYGSEFMLKETASPAFQSLNVAIKNRQQQVQRKIDQLLRNPDYLLALQTAFVTERDGRLVFPVKAEFKSKIPGIIHGASSSGATVFVEPKPLLDLNNQLQELHAALQKEILRIVKEISVALQPHWEILDRFCEALGQLDRYLSASRLSRTLDANAVRIETGRQCLQLRQARHPLLLLQHLHAKNMVISNDLTLGLDDIRTLVVTGPNTGGKTVLLKMAGLFALMLRAGLHLPVAEQSAMSLFDPILVDIGDQQNISQNLSTFSAHMSQLTRFVDPLTPLSTGLVLLDEIAAGTDPVEGAAIAKAILEELYRKGAITLVTTHLSSLKLDAHQHTGFVNASVAFDPEKLAPTYQLLIGIPGASNGIIIAEKLGLNPSVVQAARAALDRPERESAELLQEFELKTRQVTEELDATRRYREEAQIAFETIDRDRQTLEREKRQLLKQFQHTLKGQVHELEKHLKEIRKAIQQGKTDQLDGMATELRQIGQQADRVFTSTEHLIEPVYVLTLKDLTVGEKVFSKQLDLTAEVDSLLPNSEEVVLRAGILKATVPVSDLQKLPGSSGVKPKKHKAKNLVKTVHAQEGHHSNAVALDPSVSCDIRGLRAEEGLLALENFLDDALRQGYSAVGVVHGLGTGALKKAIREYLAQSAYVKRFYPAQATRGGDGKTIIEL